LTAGLAASFVITRLVSSLLYGISSTDAVSFAGAALLVVVVAMTACVLPARRASKVDPIAALHHE
jgi:putative ABC transport system permease protein